MKVWDPATSSWVYTPSTVPLLAGALVPPVSNAWPDATDVNIGWTPGVVHGTDLEFVTNADIGPDHYPQVNSPGYYLLTWQPTLNDTPTVFVSAQFKSWNFIDSINTVQWSGNIDTVNNMVNVIGVFQAVRPDIIFTEFIVAGTGGVGLNTPVPPLTIIRIG